MRPPANPQHSGTIVNGISRIGFMAGGRRAWWVDEDMSDRFVSRAIQFIRENRDRPFFLFLSLRDVHVPRLPHSRFVGKSGLGLRGDAIVEMDWMVGAIADELADLGLGDNTLLIFTSDNGPVIDDGYDDGALEALGDHDPSGPYRGGKYQAWEGGTRMPFIVHWPGRVSPGVSAALVSQVDLAASLVSLAGGSVPAGAAPDSENVLPALLGESERGREHLIQQGVDAIAIRRRDWKFIDAGTRSEWAQAKHDRRGDAGERSAIQPRRRPRRGAQRARGARRYCSRAQGAPTPNATSSSGSRFIDKRLESRERIEASVDLPQGYYVEYGGQFERDAAQTPAGLVIGVQIGDSGSAWLVLSVFLTPKKVPGSCPADQGSSVREPSRRSLPPTDTATRAPNAKVQISWSSATIPVSTWTRPKTSSASAITCRGLTIIASYEVALSSPGIR